MHLPGTVGFFTAASAGLASDKKFVEIQSELHAGKVESRSPSHPGPLPHAASKTQRLDPALRCKMILTIERKEIQPDIAVLEMTGRIILGNSSREVEIKLAEVLAAQTKKVIFDLTGISILDSTGIGILVVCQGKVTKAGGKLNIACASGFVEDTLKITSVDKILNLFPTVAAAAAAF
jgi:anti-anti-sigma factor